MCHLFWSRNSNHLQIQYYTYVALECLPCNLCTHQYIEKSCVTHEVVTYMLSLIRFACFSFNSSAGVKASHMYHVTQG